MTPAIRFLWRHRFAAAVLLLALPLAPMARAQSQETGGIGGTGIASNGGVGGVTSETGGIGGTGVIPQGHPILGYGPIQAFGSVFVNGREYRIDSHTLVTIDGSPALVAALHVGDIAQVQGQATGPHGGFARIISVVHPIIGPVSMVSPGGQSATVLGQPVRAVNAEPLFASLGPGAMVAVSAQLQANGTWAAQRLTVLPPGSAFQLAAPVSRLQPGQISVAGTQIAAAPALTAHLDAGDPVIVTGVIADGGLRATAIAAAPALPAPAGTAVEMQNYFESTGHGNLEAPDGMKITGAPADLVLDGLHPVEIAGTMDEDLVVEAGEIDLDIPRPVEPPAGVETPDRDDGPAKLTAPEAPPGRDPPDIGPEETRPELPDIESLEKHPPADD